MEQNKPSLHPPRIGDFLFPIQVHKIATARSAELTCESIPTQNPAIMGSLQYVFTVLQGL
jgi:hypothetical protein